MSMCGVYGAYGVGGSGNGLWRRSVSHSYSVIQLCHFLEGLVGFGIVQRPRFTVCTLPNGMRIGMKKHRV